MVRQITQVLSPDAQRLQRNTYRKTTLLLIIRSDAAYNVSLFQILGVEEWKNTVSHSAAGICFLEVPRAAASLPSVTRTAPSACRFRSS